MWLLNRVYSVLHAPADLSLMKVVSVRMRKLTDSKCYVGPRTSIGSSQVDKISR